MQGNDSVGQKYTSLVQLAGINGPFAPKIPAKQPPLLERCVFSKRDNIAIKVSTEQQ